MPAQHPDIKAGFESLAQRHAGFPVQWNERFHIWVVADRLYRLNVWQEAAFGAAGSGGRAIEEFDEFKELAAAAVEILKLGRRKRDYREVAAFIAKGSIGAEPHCEVEDWQIWCDLCREYLEQRSDARLVEVGSPIYASLAEFDQMSVTGEPLALVRTRNGYKYGNEVGIVREEAEDGIVRESQRRGEILLKPNKRPLVDVEITDLFAVSLEVWTDRQMPPEALAEMNRRQTWFHSIFRNRTPNFVADHAVIPQVNRWYNGKRTFSQPSLKKLVTYANRPEYLRAPGRTEITEADVPNAKIVMPAA